MSVDRVEGLPEGKQKWISPEVISLQYDTYLWVRDELESWKRLVNDYTMAGHEDARAEERREAQRLLRSIVEVVDGRGKLKLKERLPTNSEIERDFYG